ncbi:MAG: hypothetical protein LBC07_01460, partial [Elusimicrobiota bacterium]|nr:hypothetical protein [Elusimicrobiota bacterium]
MTKYENIRKEETLKAKIAADYFSNFDYEPNLNNIDFVICQKKKRSDLFIEEPQNQKYYFWAEAKKGKHDIFDMLTQLILTCEKAYRSNEYYAPPWIGCFDQNKITFAEFHEILSIFNEPDFNWNTVPSNYRSQEFQKACQNIKKLLGNKIITFTFGDEDKEIKEFIKNNFTNSPENHIKIPITKDNFIQIFNKWEKEVKPSIALSKDEWKDCEQDGILDCDFYCADIMSFGGNAIPMAKKLKIILENDQYVFKDKEKIRYGKFPTFNIDFCDNGEAYKRFWNKYKRPPIETYQHYIIDRRDLLVPENIRQSRGSFFTPPIWADKSKKYLKKAFGDNWEDEYYLWDCAAGTGNLLAGLTNKYNVWASDIEEGNVSRMKSFIDDKKLDLLSNHVFQFDFLNDDFDKLPLELKKIIDDPQKRKKLIIYINPPYAENGAGLAKGAGKSGVSMGSMVYNKYVRILGNASRELFAQFFTRICLEISNCKIASFGKLKYVNAPNFVRFRQIFRGLYMGGFICHSVTFENVKGKFPISFLIWDLENKKNIDKITCDVMNKKGEVEGQKEYYSYNKKYINDWIAHFKVNTDTIGTLFFNSNDFQHYNFTYLSLLKDAKSITAFSINGENLIEASMYFCVRLCIVPTWLNKSDQFSYPNNLWQQDEEFQNDCLTFTLFHNKNLVSCHDGINHWIPFSEKEVDAKEKFDSNFMSEFLGGGGGGGGCIFCLYEKSVF